MNKVITINLNGNAYPLEENGYEALRTYLDTAARRLEGNPDKAEIIADIEQAIADKFRAVLGANKTVVVTAEVEQIIAEMGPVEDASAPAAESPPAEISPRVQPRASVAPRRATSDRPRRTADVSPPVPPSACTASRMARCSPGSATASPPIPTSTSAWSARRSPSSLS